VLRDVESGELRQIEIKGHETWYLSNTRLVVVTSVGIVIVPDDLPRDPAQLRAQLLALPSTGDGHDALSVNVPATISK
jgi:hypothetical protein